ncbi:1-acyl-sn-glycerol-3-phosphate acyltransferase [Flavobacterium silvaticum]|uniref:MMPL family transporter n=1 Tax=Flavobacterium silvaticum TaxID=1852020 RepID=A0A972FL27_9FLAO|nr:1-acyl-sn-glycerol-3-phosphate acyltransferase [Flavobacterium silvaticum]NMH27708.1 MMPL family transporter [Flavobacterium silvaticum]
MHRFFYSIHQLISRNKTLAAIASVLVLAVFTFFASKLKFEEDITKLIPVNGKKDVTAKVLKQMNFADKITVIIQSEQQNPANLQQAAQQFLEETDKTCKPYIGQIQGKIADENIQQTIDFIYDNLPLFLNDADYAQIAKKINTDSLSQTVTANYKSILSPSGMITADFIRRDPLGMTFIGLKKLQQLQLGSDFTLDNGFIMTKDKKTLLLFLTPKQSSTETEQNTLLAQKLYAIRDKINTQFKGKAELSYFGPALIAVANADIIKHDVWLTTILAMTALMVILILFYRKIFIPLIIFLPTVFGALFALAVLYFFKETISAISLGIGAILIGITIDYSLHILTHHKHNSDIATLYKDVTKPLFMSSSTTALAFLCLLLVQSEALQDLGIFAAAIVMGSAFFSLIIVPQLYKPKADNFAHKKNFIDKMAAFSFERNKWLIGGCVLLIIVCCFTSGKVKFDNNLSKLNYIPPDIKKAEKILEKSSSLTSKTIYVAAYGDSEEASLLENRDLFERLSEQQKQGKIIGFSSLGGIVLSAADQKQKIEQWNKFWTPQRKQLIQQTLVSEGAKMGFKPNTYAPFFEAIDAERQPIGIKDYESLEALQIKEFIAAKNNFHTVSTLVKVTDAQREAFINSVSSHRKVIAIDRQQMNETFLARLRDDFNTLVNYSFIAVLLILFVFFRRAALVLIAAIPIVLTGLVTAGIMGMFDIGLNIFSTIVCTLVFGHGVDFSIFMTSALQKEYTDGKDEMPVYRTSIILAALTTILGVGALIFARHPSLKSISSVSLIGVFAAIVMSFILYPVIFRAFFFLRLHKGQAPLRLRRTLHSLFSFGYYILGGFVLSVFSVIGMKLLPISKQKKLRWFHAAMSVFMGSVLKTNGFVKKRIRNLHHETFEKPAIIIANHSSFLDILAMGSLNPKIVFLVSDWVYNSPIIGRGVRLAGFYPVSNGIDNGVEHLREKVEQGFSLMIFPEGTRSVDNSIKRFHKGAFYLAEQFKLDIVPIIIHGYSEVAPKGDFILYTFPTTVEILPRITPENQKFGSDFAQRTKKINTYMREKYRDARQEFEGPDYFKKRIVESFDYKEQEIEKAVRADLKSNSGVYFKLGKQIGPNAKILHIANDYGQLNISLAFGEPLRNIDCFIADEEKRNIAKTNYVNKIRPIHYLDRLDQATQNRYDILLISAKDFDINATPSAIQTIIVLDNVIFAEKLERLGFDKTMEEDKITILKR